MTSPPKDRQDSGTDPTAIDPAERERAKFLSWATEHWKSHAWRHTSDTSGEWAAWQAALSSSPQGGAAAHIVQVGEQICHIDSCEQSLCMQTRRCHYEHYFGKPTSHAALVEQPSLTFDAFRKANASRCLKWHPEGIESWSASDWMTAITGELGEAAGVLKMMNRERDGLPGNKIKPTKEMLAKELADVVTYVDLLAEREGIDLGAAVVQKFNEVSERVGFPDRIVLAAHPVGAGVRQDDEVHQGGAPATTLPLTGADGAPSATGESAS